MDISGVNQITQTVNSVQNTSPANDSSTNTVGTNNNTRANVQNANQNVTKDSKSNEKPINEVELRKAVDKLNKFMEDDNVSVEYSVHPQFKDTMIKIIDKSTGNVITECPPKKILDMVAKMCELAGIIFDKKA
jgi:flagellar protein FlaG